MLCRTGGLIDKDQGPTDSPNHNAVAAVHLKRHWPQPRWGSSRFSALTQGRRWRANLGLEAIIPSGLSRHMANLDFVTSRPDRSCRRPSRIWPSSLPEIPGRVARVVTQTQDRV